MDCREQILAELQMITGVVTQDMEYLVYLLLRNKKSNSITKEIKKVKQVDSLDDWFVMLKEV